MSKIIGITVGTPASQYANTIKDYANGNPVVLTDVSPFEHEVKVNLSCKNLFYFAEDYYESGVAEVIQDEDFPEDAYFESWSFEAKKGTSEIFADNYPAEFVDTFVPSFDLSYLLNQLDPNKPYTISIIGLGDAEGCLIFNGTYVLTFESFTFYPTEITDPTLKLNDFGTRGTYGIQIEEGTTATAYVPYVKVNGATVTKYAENFLPQQERTVYSSDQPTEYVSMNNGKLRFNLTGVSSKNIALTGKTFTLPAGTYVFSVRYIGGASTRLSSCWIGFQGNDGWGVNGSDNYRVLGVASKYNYKQDQTKKFTLTQPQNLFFFANPVGAAGETCDCKYLIFLEKGETATEPIPYTADENGNVNGIIGKGEGMTLFADEGISISAEYSVDTQKYIDKKFAELQALVLEV